MPFFDAIALSALFLKYDNLFVLEMFEHSGFDFGIEMWGADLDISVAVDEEYFFDLYFVPLVGIEPVDIERLSFFDLVLMTSDFDDCKHGHTFVYP